ncbi:hypothetical protein HDK90DRAFT_39590 [Phyllosticta capitalensis]|uniref:Uncharacterized protein n=1 Tax=Phyllosticta capitalensis TaxID=121624 RepID=A0ABR1Z4U3_9PEZI
MSFSKPSVSGLLATAILATGALAKTDIAGCTTTNTVVYGGASVIWYVPGTGEICEALDCGGGRAPPKTTVPGCPAYSGTASYSPSYLPGYGAGATSSPVADNVAATATGSVVAPGYAAPPAASSSAVGAIVVAPSVSSIKGFEPVITPAPAVSSSVIPVVKSGRPQQQRRRLRRAPRRLVDQGRRPRRHPYPRPQHPAPVHWRRCRRRWRQGRHGCPGRCCRCRLCSFVRVLLLSGDGRWMLDLRGRLSGSLFLVSLFESLVVGAVFGIEETLETPLCLYHVERIVNL